MARIVRNSKGASKKKKGHACERERERLGHSVFLLLKLVVPRSQDACLTVYLLFAPGRDETTKRSADRWGRAPPAVTRQETAAQQVHDPSGAQSRTPRD